MVIRNYRSGDEERWLALLHAAPSSGQDSFNQRPSLDVLRMVIEHPHMDAMQNLFFAEVGERLVGYAELWRTPGRPRTAGRLLVHPNWRRQRLGTALLTHIEKRAHSDGGSYLDVRVPAQQEAGRRFLEARGFSAVHYGWHLVLPQLNRTPPPQWPQGYQTRAFVPEQDERTSMELENVCFQEEWEYVPVELAKIEGFVRSPSFRAEGVIYAVHQGQVVGECWDWIDEKERNARTGQQRGDVWCLCVHPQHRRRGLGRALLLAGVQWLREQDATSAYLAVDGANQRAKHLYESVGFVTRRTDVWHRKRLDMQLSRHDEVGTIQDTRYRMQTMRQS